MAGLNVCKILLLVLGALAQHGFGEETLDFTITPTETSQLRPEDVYISCQPGTSLHAKAIFVIKIRKSGDSSPLASVIRDHKAISHKAISHNGIKTIGHINVHALENSFLIITLKPSNYKESGSYECEVDYLDAEGLIKTAKTSGDLKVIKSDLHSQDGSVIAIAHTRTREEIENRERLMNPDSSWRVHGAKGLEHKIEANAQNIASDRNILKAVRKELQETKAELQNQTASASSQAEIIKDLKQKIEFYFKELAKIKAKFQNRKVMKKCPNASWTRVDDKICFKGHITKTTWHKANETCRKEGGHLVSIHNEFQHDMVRRVALSLGLKHAFWIGLNDIAKEGHFRFDDGTDVASFQRWLSGQPNNYHNSDCVQQFVDDGGYEDGLWNDTVCTIDKQWGFVCQATTRAVDFW